MLSAPNPCALLFTIMELTEGFLQPEWWPEGFLQLQECAQSSLVSAGVFNDPGESPHWIIHRTSRYTVWLQASSLLKEDLSEECSPWSLKGHQWDWATGAHSSNLPINMPWAIFLPCLITSTPHWGFLGLPPNKLLVSQSLCQGLHLGMPNLRYWDIEKFIC